MRVPYPSRSEIRVSVGKGFRVFELSRWDEVSSTGLVGVALSRANYVQVVVYILGVLAKVRHRKSKLICCFSSKLSNDAIWWASFVRLLLGMSYLCTNFCFS